MTAVFLIKKTEAFIKINALDLKIDELSTGGTMATFDVSIKANQVEVQNAL